MKKIAVIALVFITFSSFASGEDRIDPDAIIKEAVDYWRGASSYVEASMKIHRPDWEREMSFVGWTKGEDRSLVRFTAPAKDSGNATLVHDREMWSYAPKINRTIKIPPSMMSQSWMGSDFSHEDLSKQKDIIDQFSHRLIEVHEMDGKKVYTIESIPHEDAAVVWGKEIIKVRSDYIILERSFYDQDMKLVKTLHASDIRRSGDRLYARVARMENVEHKEEWTEVTYDKINFNIPIKDTIFSQSNLSSTSE